ncbi:hypothetical protein [Elizabethkingia anophelis]|uniref:hypothetical protein n=1 Tax=Elizabethkingia anophelis TaxID=1117645 RepID=UPI00066546B1|nr:hypothetical protein [Elizabethkingia anophelis]ATL43656.1 hypothetical protein CQS02_10280 [Elizabethkingia miricola]MDV2459777.1 hypothetical protein [Elizabethkingia anophelis]MDV4078315.1 hypothetical protein [Elizabethkingia anophelis]UKY87467.1 hypothetical protein KUF63_04285 [Elizabethkingia anophelis]UKZ01577.1 hypothetical protein KUF65_04290 [Elizabethkingia anophelis]
MRQTINLGDYSYVNISGIAKAFDAKPTKLESPCSFFKKNNFKHYRYKVLKKGDIRLSVVSQDGTEYSAIQRNFQLAYIKLVRNFYGSNH